MRPTERSARKPSIETGFLATLRGLLHAQGTGAPRRPRALATLAALATALGALAFTAVPALAAPEKPETPEIQPFTHSYEYSNNVHGTSVSVEGVLNPGKTEPAGTYELDTYAFLYNKASAGKCQGDGTTEARISLGGGKEPVREGIEGLEPYTKYLVCLAVTNSAKEEAVGGPVSIVTGTPEAASVQATEVTATTARLSGVVNPLHETGLFEYRFIFPGDPQSPLEPCEDGEQEVGSGQATGEQGETVSALVTNLQPATTYYFCLDADRIEGPRGSFTTAESAPEIGPERAESVGSSEATVGATITPAGLPSTYRVEYGTSTAYGASTPEVSVGGGAIPTSVLVRLGELQPQTEYHFRFVAKNKLGEVPGEDETFTTTASAVGTSVLPDNRVYELVSSPTENITVDVMAGGAHDVTLLQGDAQAENQSSRAAADGDAVAFPAEAAHEGGSGFENEWVSTRGPAGWTASDVTAPGTQGYYAFFSSDLSVGVFNNPSSEVPVVASPSVSPGCELTRQMYLRSSDGVYHAVVAHPATPGECGEPFAADTSADDTHLVFSDNARLTAGAEASPAGEQDGGNLFDLVGGSLYQVNVLPDGHAEPSADAWLGAPPASLFQGEGSPNYSNAISSDGSRVFWTSVELDSTTPKALYLRENDTQTQSPGGECAVSGDACTVEVDAGEAKCVAEAKCQSGGGLFQTATGDGSKVFFTDANKLTASSTAEPGEPDLYEYEVATGHLSDLSVAASGHANVVAVTGVSENGEYVYFAATGVLASNTGYGGETAAQGQFNNYVLHDGVPTFVYEGNESFHEIEGQGVGDLSYAPNDRSAEVSASGAMVFESHKAFTKGYETEGQPEVDVYDPSSGRISCASCDPTGAPQFLGEQWSLLPVPGGTVRHGVPAYMFRWMSANGSRVFFDTTASLVPQDTNGVMDVYEWERAASGSEANNSCSVSSGSYSDVNGGCVFLLSGGQSTDGSYFADADAEGNNVFFTSRGQLAPQAYDENIAMYDARVAGGFPELATACTGTGCQGVPGAPPIFATPSSATFNGVGNFEPAPAVPRKPVVKPARCKKGTVRRSGRCVKAKRLGKRAKRRKK
jgi:hypothetical protein